MPHLARSLALLPLFALAACRHDPTASAASPFPHVRAVNSCSPVDGGAVSLIMTAAPGDASGSPSGPHIRVHLWTPPVQLVPGTFALGKSSGAATWFHADGRLEEATLGSVTFTQAGRNQPLAGVVQLRFPNAGAVRTTFVAPWLELAVMCG